MKLRALPIVFVLIASVAPLWARGNKAPMEPGTYKAWGPDIDEMEIVKPFHMADYDKVVVMPFDTSESPLPDPKDRSYDTIRSVLDGYTLTLVEALRPALKSKAEVERVEKAPKTAKTLIIRGKVLDLSPGSRAKRYLGGFGAGAAGTKMTGEIIDAHSGDVLARFTQERRSGGSFKFAGGNDMTVMRDSIHAVGQDIAHILDQF